MRWGFDCNNQHTDGRMLVLSGEFIWVEVVFVCRFRMNITA